jgi:PAS domain S-box-containing protein
MRAKVLIVDDEPDILRTLEIALQATDFDVSAASNGKEAIELFKSDPFDLVITDIRMPGTNGLDLLRQIKNLDEYTEVIILSGFATLENAIATLKKDGAFDYLTKPLDSIDKLIGSMNQALERRELRMSNAILVKQLTQAKKELETRIQEQTEVAQALIKSEEALRESEDRFRALVEAAPDGILVFDAKMDRFIQVNASMCRMLGYDTETLLQKNWLDISAPLQLNGRSSAEYGLELGQNTLKKGSQFIEWLFIRCDGQKILGELRMSRLPSIAQPLVRASIMDITEKRNLEVQIQHGRKMEAIGTLSGGIAHEFNNILGIILGNAELALDDLPEWNPAHDCINEIRTASLRGKDVVKGLLDFSHKTDLELRQLIELTPVIEDVLKLLRSTLPSSISIATDFNAPGASILADPHQLQQLMINLGTNASHAMQKAGGTLEIGLKPFVFDTENTPPPGLPPGRYVALTVKDDGHGIAPDIHDRIFDPYFTTKNIGEGTGMGLAVVHGIIERHDGTMTVQSEPDQGATFTIFFPQALPETP